MCIIQLLTSYKFLLADDRTALHRAIVEDYRSTNWTSIQEDCSINWEKNNEGSAVRAGHNFGFKTRTVGRGRSRQRGKNEKRFLNKRLINDPINQLIQEGVNRTRRSARDQIFEQLVIIDWSTVGWKIDQLFDITNQSVDQWGKRLTIELTDQLIGQQTKVKVEQWWGWKPV